MRFLSWLRKGTLSQAHAGARAHGAPRPRPTFRPRLEALEERCVPTKVTASTWTVTSVADSGPGSLRDEIAQAKSGDTIAFPKRFQGQITLTGGELVISKSLTIKGPGIYNLTITSEYGITDLGVDYPGSRIFEVDGSGTTVAISGMTITGGGGTRVSGGVTATPYDGYGGAILNFGTLTLSGCRMAGSNFAQSLPYDVAQFGGVIANFGTMTVSGCEVAGGNAFYGQIYGSTVGGEGGGIYNAGTLTVSRSSVGDNVALGASYTTAAEGGGIYNAGTAAALTVLHSTFSNNSPDNIFGPYTDGGGNHFS